MGQCDLEVSTERTGQKRRHDGTSVSALCPVTRRQRRKKGRVGWAGTVARLAWPDRARVEPLPTPSPLTGRHRLPSVGSNSRVDGGERNLAGVQGSPMRLPGAVAGRLGASVGDRTMSCSRVWVIERVVIPVAPGPKRGLESEKSRGFQGLSPNFRPKSTFMSACRTNSESDRS